MIWGDLGTFYSSTLGRDIFLGNDAAGDCGVGVREVCRGLSLHLTLLSVVHDPLSCLKWYILGF